MNWRPLMFGTDSSVYCTTLFSPFIVSKKWTLTIYSSDGDDTVRDLALPCLQALRHRRRPWAVILQYPPSFLRAAALLPHRCSDRSSRIVTIFHASVADDAATQRQLPSTPRGVLVCLTTGAAAHHGPSAHRAPCTTAASTASSPKAVHVCTATGGTGRGSHCLPVLTAQHGHYCCAYGGQLNKAN